ncbi:MAG TPA: hypothetical protein VFO10_24945 [Oligoflexus sp.]|uniref:hypothetical protein n=1 Tax=Oligoflexus sp. TaxID=1971216 RepID=UPI002D807D0A|nr:hypothetical protein [Oligoflexus sp.]HET9240535.1 hypothetical protein [Oligoflexus sp.]
MADKKITIKPSDMERLRELMRQEEAKLDAANPSDTELNEWEDRLEDSVRKLAQKTPGSLPTHTDEMNRNWSALQDKISKAAPVVQDTPKPADVLPLKRPNKNKMLPFLGLAAAAALVFIMVRPQSSDDALTMNEQNVQIKGTAGQTAAADCELDVAALDGSSVVPTANGLGFVGNVGADVEISVRCSSSGFMRVEAKGSESLTLNTAVTNGERQRILREGQIARFPLQSGQPWSISLVLTGKELSKDAVVPQDQILWQDTITVGARE